MRNRKPMKSTSALALRLAVSLLALWLTIMVFATLAVEQFVYAWMTSEHEDNVERIISNARLDSVTEENLPENVLAYDIYEALDFADSCEHTIFGGILSETSTDCQNEVIIYDENEEIVFRSGSYFYFWYMTEKSWYAGEDPLKDGVVWVPINLEEFSADFRYGIRGREAMRFTGVLRGNQMEPAKIEYIDGDEFQEALLETEPDEVSGNSTTYVYVVSQEVESLGLPWHTLWEASQPPEGELVTLYTYSPRIALHGSLGPVEDRTGVYASLAERLDVIDPGSIGFSWNELYHDTWDTVHYYGKSIYDPESYENEAGPEVLYTVVSAVRFSPIKIALPAMRRVCWMSFLLFAAVGLCLWMVVMRRLVKPIQDVNEAASKGGQLAVYDRSGKGFWRETLELERHYSENRSQLSKLQDENTRLTAALEYAQEAEQNRRQMTSSIAHELKTPLAVVHGYAEGLKEHIAENKRERYLDIILSETERMDAMVLEMLDLSRLEAGKVHLTRASFSLAELTRQVLEQLALRIEERELQVTADLQEGTVWADEGRIWQVVSNFVSNAVKYTPPGGRIAVRVRQYRGGVAFAMENDGTPFTEEELQKVWNTFYRTDKARSGEGTGLGLAIARQIIELHGGQVSVRNTDRGVEFGFSLPTS